MRATDLLLEPVKKYRQSINPPYRRRDLISILGTLFILLALPLTVFVAIQVRPWGPKAAGTAAAPTTIGSVIEPGSMVTEASYIIFAEGSNYYAKDGKTGEIQFSGSDAATVIQSALNAVPSGGVVQLTEGNYTIASSITVPGEKALRGNLYGQPTLTLGGADVKIRLAPGGTPSDSRAHLERLSINGASQAIKLITVEGQYSMIDRVAAYGTSSAGTCIELGANSDNSIISQVEVSNCGIGIDVLAEAYDTDLTDVRVGASNYNSNWQAGLRVAAGAGSIRAQNLSIWYYKDGILLRNGAGEFLFNQLTILGAGRHCIHIEPGVYDVYINNFRLGAGSIEQPGTFPDVLIEKTTAEGAIQRIHFSDGYFKFDATSRPSTAVKLINTTGDTPGPIRFDNVEFADYPAVFNISGNWDLKVRNSEGYSYP